MLRSRLRGVLLHFAKSARVKFSQSLNCAEKSCYTHIENMVENTSYDLEKDVTYFTSKKIGTQHILEKSEYLIIYLGQAHMPCVNAKEATWVRKTVIKIPIHKLKRIIFIDVDCTLTDGKIYIGDTGELMKALDVKDRYAITTLLPKHEIISVIITGRKSEIVSK